MSDPTVIVLSMRCPGCDYPLSRAWKDGDRWRCGCCGGVVSGVSRTRYSKLEVKA